MKTAIYIEDGDVQLVLTPENEWEQKTLNTFGENVSASIMRGQFYACQGGWHRHSEFNKERSLILRARSKVDAG